VEGVLIEDFGAAAELELGGFKAYRDRNVVASLVQNGLLDVEQYKAFGLVSRARHVPTAQGREANHELKDLISTDSERLAEWVADDLGQALSYVRGAGAAILLLHYGALSHVLVDDRYYLLGNVRSARHRRSTETVPTAALAVAARPASLGAAAASAASHAVAVGVSPRKASHAPQQRKLQTPNDKTSREPAEDTAYEGPLKYGGLFGGIVEDVACRLLTDLRRGPLEPVIRNGWRTGGGDSLKPTSDSTVSRTALTRAGFSGV
jgi:hypothetical protein